MSANLRPYQADLFKRAMRSLNKHQRVLVQCPTGGGKTVIATATTEAMVGLELRVWFICHRAELVHQTSLTFAQAGVAHSFIAAGREFDENALVHICSIDTLKARLNKINIAPNVVLWDEAHHVGAAGWTAVMQGYSSAMHIGLSATPIRLDGGGLDAHFEALIEGPAVEWLIGQGFLSPYRVFAPSSPDLRGVHSAMGDFKPAELAEACDKPALIGDAVEHWKRHALGLRTVVFAVTVKHSQSIVEAFNAAGVPAAHLDGTTAPQERAELIRRFADGELQVLSNVALFGEGFDLSAIAGRAVTIDCVILMRPTQSLSLYLQQVGRALRPAPGKTAVILDHAGNSSRHGLPDDARAWTLKGRDKKNRDADEGPAAPFTCMSCFNQIRRPTPSHCPHCHAEIPVASRLPALKPGELREIKRAERDAELAAKAAAKTAREAAKAAEAEAKAAEAQRRKAEMWECRTMEQLVELGRSRKYDYPRHWAEQQIAHRPALAARFRAAARA